jgi:hypothetical protein
MQCGALAASSELRRPSTTSERTSVADLAQQLRRPKPCVVRRWPVEYFEGAPNGTPNNAVANLVGPQTRLLVLAKMVRGRAHPATGLRHRSGGKSFHLFGLRAARSCPIIWHVSIFGCALDPVRRQTPGGVLSRQPDLPLADNHATSRGSSLLTCCQCGRVAIVDFKVGAPEGPPQSG